MYICSEKLIWFLKSSVNMHRKLSFEETTKKSLTTLTRTITTFCKNSGIRCVKGIHGRVLIITQSTLNQHLDQQSVKMSTNFHRDARSVSWYTSWLKLKPTINQLLIKYQSRVNHDDDRVSIKSRDVNQVLIEMLMSLNQGQLINQHNPLRIHMIWIAIMASLLLACCSTK